MSSRYLGPVIKYVRENNEMSLSTLSEKSQISESYLDLYEQALIHSNFAMERELCKALEISTEDLLNLREYARPSWVEIGLTFAHTIAERSSDNKHRVGACILSNQSHIPLSFGYNGRAPGEPNQRESQVQGKSGFLHAEENALLLAGGRWSEGEKHTLFCTHEPCDLCARRILRVGKISRVVFSQIYVDDWRESQGLPFGRDILRSGGVEVFQVSFGKY